MWFYSWDSRRVQGRERRFCAQPASVSSLWTTGKSPCPRKLSWAPRYPNRSLITLGMGAWLKVKRNISTKTFYFHLLSQKNPTKCVLIKVKSTKFSNWLYVGSQGAQGFGEWCFRVDTTKHISWLHPLQLPGHEGLTFHSIFSSVK